VDAREFYVPMRRSLGDKRRKVGEGTDAEPDQISDIVRLYARFAMATTARPSTTRTSAIPA